MDTKVRDVIVEISISPVFWKEIPEMKIQFNQQDLWCGSLDKPTVWAWTLPAQDINRLSVWFLNKTEHDTQGALDKALVIDHVALEGLKLQSFLFKSRYQPRYSEGYINSRLSSDQPLPSVINCNYLGFNGEWWLEWPWPTFDWIYSIETSGMGWVYEKNI